MCVDAIPTAESKQEAAGQWGEGGSRAVGSIYEHDGGVQGKRSSDKKIATYVTDIGASMSWPFEPERCAPSRQEFCSDKTLHTSSESYRFVAAPYRSKKKKVFEPSSGAVPSSAQGANPSALLSAIALPGNGALLKSEQGGDLHWCAGIHQAIPREE